MGRKKKNEAGEEFTPKQSLKNETIGWVVAIGFFAVSIFFILASLGKAGFVGEGTFSLLTRAFGIGYFLIPLALIFLAIAYIKATVRPVSKLQLSGALVFFLSCLAMISMVTEGRGGAAGELLMSPLVKLFDVYASAVLLLALVVISILVIFDTSIKFSSIINLFRKKEPAEEPADEPKITGLETTPIQSKAEERELPKTKPLVAQVPRDEEFEGLNFRRSRSTSKEFTPPPLSLLERDKGKPEVGDVKANANIIKRTLHNFGIIVDMDEVSIGPSVTRYALKPAEGVKLSKILGLQNNLELALAAHPVRIEAPIPGKSLVGIEIPNTTKTMLGLGTILSQSDYQDSNKNLLVALGKGISGTSKFDNLAKMPHLLIAGATGSGKSVTVHVLINSLLFRNHPDNLKFIMVDPKRVELTLYNKIPHLLTPVITDAKKAIQSLKWAAKEMDRRYNILEQSKVRDIDSYHKNIFGVSKDPTIDPMPYIVIIIDELADIMQAYPRELEAAIVRLAQMSRAVGIHLIISTQRPSVNVITGLIKANVPSRIALQVASQIDSRTILDAAGAEKLLGAGDMLYQSAEMPKPIRIQCPFISENEVKKVVEYLADTYENELPNEVNMDPVKSGEGISNAIFDAQDGSEDEDDLYPEAKEVVIQTGKASTSYLQRKLRVGYARAARLIDLLEEKGVIGPGEGAKPRDVLIKPDNFISQEESEEYV